MKLTKDLYNRVARYLRDLAINDKGDIYINLFGDETKNPKYIATLEIPLYEYKEYMDLDLKDAVSILDQVVRKLFTLEVEHVRRFGKKDHHTTSTLIVSGFLQGETQDGVPTLRRFDYLKGYEEDIWSEYDDYFLEETP